MTRYINLITMTAFCAIASTTAATSQDGPSIKRTAALSEFGARLDALEQVVDDVSLSGALALLGQVYPESTFDRSSGFDGVTTAISNDLGAVAGDHDYALSKIRGAIVRNQFVPDDQRERAIAIFSSVRDLIQLAYELERHIDEGSFEAAGELYNSEMLCEANMLTLGIHELSDAIEQAVKFSAL